MAGTYRRPTSPTAREKAAHARDAKLTALHRDLTEQVTALASGPEWRRWLEVASKFHSYSFNNTILIWRQLPTATHVAGYNLWRDLGRQVTKGEKGLAILAPVIRKVDTTTPDQRLTTAPAASPDAARSERRVVGFRPTYVWDISQTTGEPLPLPPQPTLLRGQAPTGLWDALAAQCAAAGFTVDRQPIAGEGGPNGYTSFSEHAVVVRSDVDDAQAVKTLAHELGHVLLHDPADFPAGPTGRCRGAEEVEAESVAYLIAAEHGLDTSGYTFAYVAAWANQAGDLEHTLRETGARILRTAHHVLDQAHDHLTPADPATTDQLAVTAERLAARATAGAERTATLRETAALPAAPATTVPLDLDLDLDRLRAANASAHAFFHDQYRAAGSWAPEYLHSRLGTSLNNDSGDQSQGVGYAPAGWTTLVDHLHRQGFTDAELLDAGLATRAKTGRLVDRFRDRLMFPIRDTNDDADGAVVGFVGRRNPQLDTSGDPDLTGQYLNPKYLNTPQTPLYTKGDHLYGLSEAGDPVERGGLAVLVEGPVDKHAVDLASDGMFAGVAALGTAVTHQQAGLLRELVGDHIDRVVVATDDDRAGRAAAARAYDVLTSHGLAPRGAALPTGLDPALVHEQHGPAALVGLLADAEPLARQLATRAVLDSTADRSTAEGSVRARRAAAAVLVKAPPGTWPTEITAVAQRTGLDPDLLRDSLIEAVHPVDGAEDDALGRLLTRDRRDDLDRGQYPTGTAAEVAALSKPPTMSLRSPADGTAQVGGGASKNTCEAHGREWATTMSVETFTVDRGRPVPVTDLASYVGEGRYVNAGDGAAASRGAISPRRGQ